MHMVSFLSKLLRQIFYLAILTYQDFPALTTCDLILSDAVLYFTLRIQFYACACYIGKRIGLYTANRTFAVKHNTVSTGSCDRILLYIT